MGFFSGARRTLRRVTRKVTPKVSIPKVKINIKPPKPVNLAKLLPKKPDIVKKLQTQVAGGADQFKKNVHTATSKAREAGHGLATDAKTGLHLGTSNLRDLAHKGATGVKAAWDTARGKGPKEATGGGGTGASAVAMGSDTGVKEDSKIGDKGKQFDTGKKKRLNQSKRKFKVQVA